MANRRFAAVSLSSRLGRALEIGPLQTTAMPGAGCFQFVVLWRFQLCSLLMSHISRIQPVLFLRVSTKVETNGTAIITKNVTSKKRINNAHREIKTEMQLYNVSYQLHYIITDDLLQAE